MDLTGADLIPTWLSGPTQHARFGNCPGCGQDCTTTGITHLAYPFRECECGTPEYPHLIEQRWHLACLQGRRPELDRAAASVLYHLDEPSQRGKQAAIEALRVALRER